MQWCLILTIISVVNQISCRKNETWKQYDGRAFPTKYLLPEESTVTATDMDYYINSLLLPMIYFNREPNDTDVSTAICVYYTKAILKRTLKDYGAKLRKNQTDALKVIIEVSENLVSHYTYENGFYDWDDIGYRVSKIFISDEAQVYSIGEFNRNKLRQWILTKYNNVHEYLEAMDKATMPKEDYTYIIDNNPDLKYFVSIFSSDECVSRIAYNSVPIDITSLRKCKQDSFCDNQLYSDPSIGYYLTHRFVNIYLRISRGCYIRSEFEDRAMMDQLCANMYREAVYLARRGYFARDLFLEHIALCSMLGYEEFHRRNWFYKASSWINHHGCVVENRNFVRNRTRIIKDIPEVRRRLKLKTHFCRELLSECDEHPTALLTTVLANGIRHAARFMNYS